MLGLYGGKDQGIPQDQVDKMSADLAAAKKPSKIDVFPEAEHGFLADYRPSYNPEAAAAGWKQCLEWFREHGVG